jgi:hypothetical protein
MKSYINITKIAPDFQGGNQIHKSGMEQRNTQNCSG